MNRSIVVRHALVVAALLVVLPLAAQAQSSRTKAPPQLPPTPSQTSQIPAGVDAGSPMTSGNAQLGTPVPPNNTSNGVNQRNSSAAARAAARPDPLTRTGVPLSPAPPVVGPAVIRQASRPASGSAQSQADAEKAFSCAASADPSYRQQMAQCTALTDRNERTACAERTMATRGCS